MGVAQFRQDLGLATAITLIVGSMIGSGILILPGVMAGQLGNSGILLLAWILPGLLTIAGALTFAEMASAYPRAGGQYVFLREGLGRGWSFLYGWSMFWVIQTGIIAAVAIAFATFVDFFFDLPGQFTPLGPLTVPPWGVAVVAVGCILLLSAVNYLGVKYGGVVQNVTTAAKVLGIVGLVVGILLFGRPNHDVLGSALVGAPQGAALLSVFGLAVVSALFAYDGWPQATYVAAEVKDAKRNLPRALIIAPLITMAIYVSTVFAYIYALDIGAASAAGRPGGRIAADAALAVLGPTAAAAIVVVALVSTFGTVNAYVLSSPRVFYALSKDGAFLKSMGKLHPKRATPAFATVLMAEWASLLVLTGTYAQLVIVVVFSLWLFYIPTALAYFRLHKDRSVAKPFTTPGYPVVPLIFLGSAVFIVLNTLLTAPTQALFSLVLIAAGVPVFAWQARRAGLPAGRREWVLAPLGERGT